MGYLPNLIPEEHRVLKEYFRAGKGKDAPKIKWLINVVKVGKRWKAAIFEEPLWNIPLIAEFADRLDIRLEKLYFEDGLISLRSKFI